MAIDDLDLRGCTKLKWRFPIYRVGNNVGFDTELSTQMLDTIDKVARQFAV